MPQSKLHKLAILRVEIQILCQFSFRVNDMFGLRKGLRLVPRAIQAQENVQQCAFECIVFVVDGKGNISVPAVLHDVPEEE